MSKKKMKDTDRFSILADDMHRCVVCGAIASIELHEVYFGSGKRDLSKKWGLVVPLCYQCHRGTDGVHGRDGHLLDMELKRKAQIVFGNVYPDENFLSIFGRNYIDDDDE